MGDNSPVTTDAVVYIHVTDLERISLQVDNCRRAVPLFAQTTLRTALGDMELDDTLTCRDYISACIRRELDRPTDEWGTRVESVGVREVKPSKDVESAMEQQTSAERRRRAMILETQGGRRSAVEKAEGDEQSNVICTQSEKQPQILKAQGNATSTMLRTRAAGPMGGCTIIDKGMEMLADIGASSLTTYVLPQELTSLFGRYGEGLSGSNVQQVVGLESKAFDEEICGLLGLGDIDEILGELDGVETTDISTDAVNIETGDGGIG